MRRLSHRPLIFAALSFAVGCQPQISWDVHYQETGSCAVYEDSLVPGGVAHLPFAAFHLVSVTNASPAGGPKAVFNFRKLSITGSDSGSELDAMPGSISPVYGDSVTPGRTHLYQAHEGNMAGFLPGENPEELKNETFYLTYASPPGVSVKLTKDPSQKWVLPYCNRQHLRSF